jgi:hypothetical protein
MAEKRAALEQAISRTREAGGRTWLYGAGVHSSSLVATLALAPSDVDELVDDNDAVTGKVLPNLDLPIGPASRLSEASAADLVVVSGFSFQEEMLARLARTPTRARVLKLYPRVELAAVAPPLPAPARA